MNRALTLLLPFLLTWPLSRLIQQQPRDEPLFPESVRIEKDIPYAGTKNPAPDARPDPAEHPEQG